MEVLCMKLNYRRTLVVGLAFFSICAFWQLYDHVVPLMLEFTFKLNGTLIGGVMAIDNVLALVLLPFFGLLSDKTKTRWGRRMPYIVLGSFAACATMMLIPIANNLASLPLFMAGLGLTLLFMAAYRSPAVALMPDVTPKPLRSKGNAIINLTGVIGNLLSLGLIAFMLPKLAEGATEYHANYAPVYLMVMGVMLVSVVILMLAVNEPAAAGEMERQSIAYGIEENPEAGPPTEKRAMKKEFRTSLFFLMASIALWFMGYNAVTTFFSTYSVKILGMGPGASSQVLMIAQVAAIIAFLPSAFIATRYGRKKTIMGGILLLTLAFGSAAFFTGFSPLIFAQFALAGIGWACINVNSLPMVVELARAGEVGRFTGFYYTASMAAQIVTPVLARTLMDIETRILLPYGALFVLLSFITMCFVKHGDSKPLPPQNKLEAFEALSDG
jgi:Na+/melibiose symporter-like transporter